MRRLRREEFVGVVAKCIFSRLKFMLFAFSLRVNMSE